MTDNTELLNRAEEYLTTKDVKPLIRKESGLFYQDYEALATPRELAAHQLIQELHDKLKEREWQPKELFEKEGAEVIGWLTTDQGFEDITAKLTYYKGLWNWGDDEENPVKRQDMILGVKPWPTPPEVKDE